jgi:tetratricopeptide (TPR) repeat protein
VVDNRRARFVGIGVGTYRHGQPRLPAACRDITRLGRLFDPHGAPATLLNPTEHEAQRLIEAVRAEQHRGPLILAWSGHSTLLGDDLRLLAADSEPHMSAGLSIREVVLKLADSGTSQLFVIIDTCFAGEGAMPALSAALKARLLNTVARAGVWAGVLTSCQPHESAIDGAFGRRLCGLLERGPSDARSRRSWPPHSPWVTGDALGQAIQREWSGPDSQSPMYVAFGDAMEIIRNPLYRAGPADGGARERVVEHILRDDDDEFVGRADEVQRVATWIRMGDPGVYLLAGSSGTGKSAILRRAAEVVGRPVVNATGRTPHQLAASISHALAATDQLPIRPEPAGAGRLLDALRHAAVDGLAPAVVIDGFRESDVDTSVEVAQLLLRMAQHVAVVVAARGTQVPFEPLRPREVLDLDDPAVARDGLADLRVYITERLQDVTPAMDPEAVAEHVVALAARPAARPFLLGRVTADHLRAEPVDTGAPGWRERVHGTVRAMVAADLSAVVSPGHRALPPGVPPTTIARHLLAALSWGYGAGFPEDEWIAVSDATGPLGVRLGRADVAWLLDELGRYIVQDSERGVATYRIAHEDLAEMLDVRPDRSIGGAQERAVATVLIERYQRLVAGGVPVDAPHYLWEYAWRHAVDAGVAGLRAFRDLATTAPSLSAAAALAEIEHATRLRDRGERAAALRHTECAVDELRGLAERDSVHTDDLAAALGNLGALYRDAGRPGDAAAATEEAVTLYRQSDAGGTAAPDVAALLSNLGVYLREAGRIPEAHAAGQESVAMFRELVAVGRALSDDLAMALTGFAMSHLVTGRQRGALAAAQAAVELYRQALRAGRAIGPHLGNALHNLSVCLRESGRRAEAATVAGEAVETLQRELPAAPAVGANLGNALTNLSACLRDQGESDRACAAAREAVDVLRRAGRAEPALRPQLGAALTTYGTCLRELGRPGEAELAAQEAVGIFQREATAGHDAMVGLARALGQLGAARHVLGRHTEALADAEESIRLLRDAVASGRTPDFDLAAGLTNLSLYRNESDAPATALAAAREAVTYYRRAAMSRPRLRAGLAGALTNLAVVESRAGSIDAAVTVMEEAVVHLRRLAGDRAGLPRLAAALNTLGVFHGLAGRHLEAIAAVEEAVERYRDLASNEPTLIEDLASALENLGSAYRLDGRPEEAATAADEAVDLYRHDHDRGAALSVERAVDLAGSLRNSASAHHAAGRPDMAAILVDDAVGLLLQTAVGNRASLPVVVPELADVLSTLESLVPGTATENRVASAWDRIAALGAAAPPIRLARAASARAGDPRAAVWLRAAAGAASTGGVAARLRSEARRHRAADVDVFDKAWCEGSGASIPDWLTVDPDLLAAARTWVVDAEQATGQAHLAGRPDLLHEAADAAVEEALLTVAPDRATTLRRLRVAARVNGVEAAYRPLRRRRLAEEFAAASTARQRALLARDRVELCGNGVRSLLANQAAGEPDDATGNRARAALALLDLAEVGADHLALAALEDAPPQQAMAAFLHALATSANLAALAPAAALAGAVATSGTTRSTALFYQAIACAAAGDTTAAAVLAGRARAADPDQACHLVRAAAAIVQQLPAAVPVLVPLTGAG